MSEIIPCPDCYGGHFRPCQVCGDAGSVQWKCNGHSQHLKYEAEIAQKDERIKTLADEWNAINADRAELQKKVEKILEFLKGHQHQWDGNYAEYFCISCGNYKGEPCKASCELQKLLA